MKTAAAIAAAAFGLLALPAKADINELQAALSNGLVACQNWILEPKTWAEDDKLFASNIGLDGKLIPMGGIPSGVLPDGLMASATNFWRIDAGNGNGVFVVASSTIPVCNVAGGGPSDFQPDAEMLVAKIGQGQDWKIANSERKDDMTTTFFKGMVYNNNELVVSRASKAGDRTDRVQFLASVTFNTGN